MDVGKGIDIFTACEDALSGYDKVCTDISGEVAVAFAFLLYFILTFCPYKCKYALTMFLSRKCPLSGCYFALIHRKKD